MAKRKTKRRKSVGRKRGTKRTKYQILQARAKSYCAGRVKKSSLNKAIDSYTKDAKKKGKSAAEINAIVSRVTACKE